MMRRGLSSLMTNWTRVAGCWCRPTYLDSGSDHVHGVGDGGGGGGCEGAGHGLQDQMRAVARRQFRELLWNISRMDIE